MQHKKSKFDEMEPIIISKKNHKIRQAFNVRLALVHSQWLNKKHKSEPTRKILAQMRFKSLTEFTFSVPMSCHVPAMPWIERNSKSITFFVVVEKEQKPMRTTQTDHIHNGAAMSYKNAFAFCVIKIKKTTIQWIHREWDGTRTMLCNLWPIRNLRQTQLNNVYTKRKRARVRARSLTCSSALLKNFRIVRHIAQNGVTFNKSNPQRDNRSSIACTFNL